MISPTLKQFFCQHIVCPRCRAGLQWADALGCSNGDWQAEMVANIPWLYLDGEQKLSEWRFNARVHLQQMDQEIARFKSAIQDHQGLPETKKRLARHLQALIEQRKFVAETLSPLKLEDDKAPPPTPDKTPATQSVFAYYNNLHRDWGWPETAENEIAQRHALGLLQRRPKERILIMGAGGSRLAYDLCHALEPEFMLAVDINPLLFLVADRVLRGKTVKAYEFPLAPTSLDATAILRKLKAPRPVGRNLGLCFMDACSPPLRQESFDIIVTPWFVDIIPEDLPRLCLTINNLLKPSGVWLNQGSVAFQHHNPARQYTQEEAIALVTAAGFAMQEQVDEPSPYLQSPASRQLRMETVWSFVAEKTEHRAQPEKVSYLPRWLALDSEDPVPRKQEFLQFGLRHQLFSDVIAAVDGRRTIRQVADQIGGKYQMSEAEAATAVARFLTAVYEESHR